MDAGKAHHLVSNTTMHAERTPWLEAHVRCGDTVVWWD